MLETPILYIVFNRLDTVKMTFPVIKKQKPKYLYIAADGPRKNIPNEELICNDVRNWILNNIDWDCKVETLFRSENAGCKYGVAGAIKWFFSNVESGIVMEDDILASDTFFIYCEKALKKYKDNKTIGFISGCTFTKFISKRTPLYFLATISGVWGWASWRDRLEKYDPDLSSKLLDKKDNIFISKQASKYIIENSYKAAIAAKGTWDYQMTDYLASNGMYTLFPRKNLILNVGFMNNSAHTVIKPKWYTEEKFEYEVLLPDEVKLDKNYSKKYEKTNIPKGMRFVKDQLIKIPFIYDIYISLKNKANVK